MNDTVTGLGMAIAAPAESDWIVSLFKRGGEVVRYRISPGTCSQEDALRKGLLASKTPTNAIADATVVRARDHRRVIVEDTEAEFRRLSANLGRMFAE
jgi:hypothetical protein